MASPPEAADKKRKAQELQDINAFLRSEEFRGACKQEPWYWHWRAWIAVTYPIAIGIAIFGIVYLIGIYVPNGYKMQAFAIMAILVVSAGAAARFMGNGRVTLSLVLLKLMISPYRQAFKRFLLERK